VYERRGERGMGIKERGKGKEPQKAKKKRKNEGNFGRN